MTDPKMTPEQIAEKRRQIECDVCPTRLELGRLLSAEHARAEALAAKLDDWKAAYYGDTKKLEAALAAMTRQRDEAYERAIDYIRIHADLEGDVSEAIAADMRLYLAADAASAPSASPLSGASYRSGPGNREADPAAPADGWRPIETAPRDGTVILAFWNSQIKLAFWNAVVEPANWEEWPDGDFGCCPVLRGSVRI